MTQHKIVWSYTKNELFQKCEFWFLKLLADFYSTAVLLLKIFQNWESICYCFDKLRCVNVKSGMRPSQFFDLIGLAFNLHALNGQFDNDKSKQKKFSWRSRFFLFLLFWH